MIKVLLDPDEVTEILNLRRSRDGDLQRIFKKFKKNLNTTKLLHKLREKLSEDKELGKSGSNENLTVK